MTRDEVLEVAREFSQGFGDVILFDFSAMEYYGIPVIGRDMRMVVLLVADEPYNGAIIAGAVESEHGFYTSIRTQAKFTDGVEVYLYRDISSPLLELSYLDALGQCDKIEDRIHVVDLDLLTRWLESIDQNWITDRHIRSIKRFMEAE